MLLEVVGKAVRKAPGIPEYYLKLSVGGGKPKAIVAVA